MLAPPVPIEELAAAHGLIAEQVESFAADLAPLLERTPHGLMFRDEPTPRTDYSEFRYAPRPDASPRPEDGFHLDYDFNKYQVERLCHVFACPGWEVEDRIGAWVRR